MKPILRNKTYHLRRRVPRRYRPVEHREIVEVTLATDSLAIAHRKASEVWEENIEAWEAKLRGETDVAAERFEAARDLAHRRGMKFLSADQVARLPMPELMERIDKVYARGHLDRREADALLGGAVAPKVRVSDALEDFWHLTRAKVRKKSPNQLRIWSNIYKRAVTNFISVHGNPAIDEITRDMMLDYHDWWLERIDERGMTENSANRDIGALSAVLKTVNEKRRMNLDLPLGGLSFKEAKKERRPPFSVAWIRDTILAPDALASMNLEARCILLGMVNTGYRPSEGANLSADRIRLDTDIPHILVRPDGREVKSENANREIPLVGISLEAFRTCPEGFPRYRDGHPDAAINKYLREHGLMESERHTLYGLRHSFEDRLLVAGVDERVRRDLMGHALHRERYGEGGGLETRLRAVQAIAL